MVKQIHSVVHLYYGILLNNKKEQTNPSVVKSKFCCYLFMYENILINVKEFISELPSTTSHTSKFFGTICLFFFFDQIS